MQKIPNQTAAAVLRNVAFGFTTWILPLLISFITTPIIIRNLGAAEYGIFALVLGFIGYSFNFNFGRAVTKYIAEHRVAGRDDQIADIVSTAFFLCVTVGAVGVVSLLLGADLLVENVVRIEEADKIKTVSALYTASLIIFCTVISQIPIAVLQGIHRFDVYSKILNVFNFALLIGNLLLAISGKGIIGLLYWNLIINVGSTVFFSFNAKRLLPEFRFQYRFKKDIFKLIVYYSAAIIGYQIITNALLLFERSWIIRHLGAENLTFYVVPLTLAICIHGFISSLIVVIFPLASELKNQPDKLLRLYKQATRIVCFMVAFLATALIVESNFFLTVWIGQELAEKTTALLIIHTVAVSIVAIQTVSWQMIEGLGYPICNFLMCGVSFLINVSLIFALTENFGTVGVAVGKLTAACAIVPFILFVEKWIFQRVQIEFWARLLFVLTASSISAGVLIKFIVSGFAPSWYILFAATAGGGIFYTLTAWFLGIVDPDEKRLMRDFIIKRLRR